MEEEAEVLTAAATSGSRSSSGRSAPGSRVRGIASTNLILERALAPSANSTPPSRVTQAKRGCMVGTTDNNSYSTK
jgi:hypothetical protein